MKPELEEIHTDFRRVETNSCNRQFPAGTIVRWKYEWPGDPQNGMLYMVIGFNNEAPNIVVTRILSDLGCIREFHASQLESII
jgi:hypothetical protein